MKRIFTILTAIVATVSYFDTQAQISNYCTTNASYTSDSYIAGVNLNTINNTSTACTGYTDFTSINTTLTKGATYTIEVTYGSCLGNHYTNYMGVWIDWNQNNTFDASELVASMGPTTFTGHVLSGTFTVPATAMLDTTYMRVKSVETGSTPGTCGSFSWGEAEDYMIIIAPPYADDAGVASIDSPAAFCEGTRNVIATIQNYGSNQINSVLVNWSINGNTQIPVNHTTLLDTIGGVGSNTAQVLLGTNFFGAGITDSIEVWTSNPNNTTDPNPVNDMQVAALQPSLSGVFTIDPAGTGLTN